MGEVYLPNFSWVSLERAIRVAQRKQIGTGLAQKALVLPKTPGKMQQQRDVNCIAQLCVVKERLDRSGYKPATSFVMATSSSVVCNFVFSKIMRDRFLW